MGDLYASAIGTTVLQLKEIPPRPEEYDGAICLFGGAVCVDEVVIRTALDEFGSIKSVQVGGWPPVIVRFTTHEAAVAAKQAKERLLHIVGEDGGIDTLYNERSYDGSEDNGRGW